MSSDWMPPSEWADQVRSEYGLTCIPRWATPRNFDRKTYGPKVAVVMRHLGTPPMPWQQYSLDTALEVDPDTGFLAYGKVGLSVVRQQGKTAQVLGLVVWRLMAWQRQSILYAAQTRNAARKKFKENFLETIGGSPLRRRFNKSSDGGVGSLGTGQESLLCLKTRSRMGITANTEKAGHGEVLDLGLADEYFSQEDDRLQQAWSPAMITRDNAQFWWLSAAGTHERSKMLNRERKAGREMVERYWTDGVPCGWAYFEWSPPEGARRDDPATWFACMPALCPDPPCRCDSNGGWHHTVTVAKVRAELESMREDLSGFDRAYLNLTRKFEPPADENVPVKAWAASADSESRRGEDVAFFIDTTPAGNYGSVGVFSVRPDGKGHAEVCVHQPGTAWIAEAVLKLKGKYNPIGIGIDDKGPAGVTLIADLERMGLKRPSDPDHPSRGDLFVMSLGDMVSAAGQMSKAIRDDAIRHPDQKQLNRAIGNTRTRSVGDGAWAFGRKVSSVDISPFIAVTGARYVFLSWADKVTDDIEPGAWWV